MLHRELFLCLCFLAIGNATLPKSLGVFDVEHAAFITINNMEGSTAKALSLSSSSETTTPESQTPYLYVSAFSAGLFKKGTVNIVNGISEAISGRNVSSLTPKALSNNVQWPNEGRAVPFDVFDKNVLAVAGGFLVPTHGTGAITLFDLDSQSAGHEISDSKSGWFYHLTMWIDIDKDGQKDVLTARATKPLFGGAKGELLWLQNPGKGLAFQQTWEEHSLFSGPDIFFALIDIDEDGEDELIASQFFSKKMVAYKNWTDPQNLVTFTIDDNAGSPFALQLADVNNDGKKDLLISNHENVANESCVYAYTIPFGRDWNKSPWKRHTVACGFPTSIPGQGQAAPGLAQVLQPKANSQGSSKPLILVAGDAAMKTYIVSPNSEDADDWSYTVESLFDGNATIGQPAVGDVDGDGYTDIFVPAYETGKVYGFTYGQ